jgi:hypothetical protein
MLDKNMSINYKFAFYLSNKTKNIFIYYKFICLFIKKDKYFIISIKKYIIFD